MSYVRAFGHGVLLVAWLAALIWLAALLINPPITDLPKPAPAPVESECLCGDDCACCESFKRKR